jgi:hypothetical protein
MYGQCVIQRGYDLGVTGDRTQSSLPFWGPRPNSCEIYCNSLTCKLTLSLSSVLPFYVMEFPLLSGLLVGYFARSVTNIAEKLFYFFRKIFQFEIFGDKTRHRINTSFIKFVFLFLFYLYSCLLLLYPTFYFFLSSLFLQHAFSCTRCVLPPAERLNQQLSHRGLVI